MRYCFNEDCFSIDLDKVVYEAKIAANKAGQNLAYNKVYGYDVSPLAMTRVVRLHDLTEQARKEHRRRLWGGGCLKERDLQALVEKIRKMTIDCDKLNRQDQTVDESGFDAWVESNPYCVSREVWEKRAYAICEGLTLKLDTVEQVCDIALDLVTKPEMCDIILTIKACEELCDLKISPKYTKKDCNLALPLLIKECTTCNLTLPIVQKCLQECNLTVSAMKSICNAGGCFTEVAGEVMVEVQGSRHKLEDLKFDSGDLATQHQRLYSKIKNIVKTKIIKK